MSNRKPVSSTREYVRSARLRSTHGLSIPNAGRIWRNNASGQEIVIMSSGPFGILVRDRQSETGTPIKLTDIEGFYREFSYVGKEKQ